MSTEVAILLLEALTMYLLVLCAHAWRHRVGLAHFYALLGGITAVMSWVTDAGAKVEVAGITFIVGSTVFYTSLLLGVFVVYVFNGPRATRVAISTVATVSILVPLIAALLHLQMKVSGQIPLLCVPMPSLRTNTASVVTTVADMFFLAIAWEYLGKPKLNLQLWRRAFLTLLAVMWLDVVLFSTGAFLGKPDYLNIMKGSLLSRFIVSVTAFPLLYCYLNWQNKKLRIDIEHRPVLAILREIAQVREELGVMQQEIARRRQVEKALRDSEHLLRLAQEVAHIGHWKLDPVTQKFHGSEEFYKIFGVGRVDSLLKLFFEAVHPEDRYSGFHQVQEGLKEGRAWDIEHRLLLKDGSLKWVHSVGHPITDDSGKVVFFIGTVHDITERKHAEEALRESERLYRSLFENMLNGLAYCRMLFDQGKPQDFIFLSVNRTFESLTGLKNVAGKKVSEVVPEIHESDKGLFDIYGKVALTGKPEKFEKYIETLKIWFLISVYCPEKGYFVAIFDNITERKRAEAALRESEKRYRELSILDSLTQLYNSRHFHSQLKIEIDRANRYGQPLTLMLLDIDDFKVFNDLYGHIRGDQALTRFGQLFNRCLRQADSAYRYGGEEFTILMPMTTSEEGVITAERIRKEFKKEDLSQPPDTDVHLTVSIGLAQYEPGEDMKDFVHRADQLMYRAKKNGKDRVYSDHSFKNTPG